MNGTTSFKSDMLHILWVVFWQAMGIAWGLAAGQLGFHGENAMALCGLLAMVTGVATSKPRRIMVVQGVRSVGTRVSEFRRARRERRSRIVRPPASRLDRIARLVWTKQTYDRVFKPLRADLVLDWQRAEARGDHKHVRRLKYVEGPWLMIQHMAAQSPSSIVKFVVGLFKNL